MVTGEFAATRWWSRCLAAGGGRRHGHCAGHRPDLPARWHREQAASAELRPIPWRNKVLASVGYMAMVKYQLRRLGRGQPSRPKIAPALALACQQWQTLLATPL